MRQGQQNRRGRGRNNNNNNNNNNHNQNRKGGQNPLSRSYESAGPDTKIRGTPAHIAEKYMQLARDAQSSGDPVLAENYLQHAEHYNRIIMTYREQQLQQNGGEPVHANGQLGRFRQPGAADDEFTDEEGDDFGSGPQPGGNQPMLRPGGDQPRFDDRPQRHQRDRDQRNFGDRGERDRGGDRERMGDRDRFQPNDRNAERPQRAERVDRPDRVERAERPDRGDRAERPDRGDRAERSDRPERSEVRTERAPPSDSTGGEPAQSRRRERAPMAAHEQPEFLRRPVRRPRRETTEEEGEEAPVAAGADEGSE